MDAPEKNENGLIRFSATLTREPDSSATFIGIPFNALSVWGTRARVAVKGTINGRSFRGSITPYGGVHYLGINRDLREMIGVKAGEIVEVELEVDNDPRIISPPPDFQAALDEQPAAKIKWSKLSYSHQREHVEAIESAKKPETRAIRIADSIERLLGKRK
jgi:hypothetical protein